jgi:hypothetical protein
LFENYRIDAQFTYSAWFMLFGAILLAVGFWRRSAFLRWQALLLIAVSIGKVFLVDMSELSQGYRILSFLGLGVLLLGVSYIYQRDLLNLRGQHTPETGFRSASAACQHRISRDPVFSLRAPRRECGTKIRPGVPPDRRRDFCERISRPG